MTHASSLALLNYLRSRRIQRDMLLLVDAWSSDVDAQADRMDDAVSEEGFFVVALICASCPGKSGCVLSGCVVILSDADPASLEHHT